MGRRALRWMSGMLLLATALPACALPHMTISQFRQDMLVPADATVRFEDAAGKPIEFAQFMDAMHGGSFSKTLDTSTDIAVFRIRSANETASSAATSAASWKVHRGDSLPAPPLFTLSGVRWTPASSDGRYTLVSFYFDTCVPCVAEIPALNAFARQHPEVRVVAVTFDDALQARAFQRKHHLDWPIVAGAQAFIAAVGVQAYPALALVRPDGTLAASLTGAGSQGRDPDQLAAWLRQAKAGMAK